MTKPNTKDLLAISESITNGRFVNLDISEFGNSKVLVIPPQIFKGLNLSVGMRVMVVPYV